MIAKLKGIIDAKSIDNIIIDVNGVGYLAFTSSRTLSLIGSQGDLVSLWIETHVREDHIHLYGFYDKAEQNWFKMLTGVQGVGAKGAMALLSACPPDEIGFIIASGDKASLTKANGIGGKIASRIITELKDKIGNIAVSGNDLSTKIVSKTDSGTTFGREADKSIDNDAVSALVNLGYARTEAYKAVLAAKEKMGKNQDNIELSKLITVSLKELAV